MRRLQTNIVAAQCKDLGMEDIQVLDQDQVQARLGTRWYVFSWSWVGQCLVLRSTWDVTQPWEIVPLVA